MIDVDVKIRTLIADDEQNGRIHLSRLLSSFPDIEMAGKTENGRQALTLIEKGGFDLVFMDIDMPELTGLEVIRELKKKGAFVPYVIFVTAYATHGATAFDLGAVDYIVKPVSSSRLDEALQKYRIFAQSGKMAIKDIGDTLGERFSLTFREIEICRLIKDGYAREDIVKSLSLSMGTMKAHLSSIYDKCGLTSPDDSGRGDKFARLLYLLFTLG